MIQKGSDPNCIIFNFWSSERRNQIYLFFPESRQKSNANAFNFGAERES